MSLTKFNHPFQLSGRRSWVENLFTDTSDFLKNWDFDKEMDVPAMNVKEEPDAFFIEVAAPGMKKEDFKIEMDSGVLKISAKSEEKKEEKERNYVRREFSFRNFNRSFWLPENIKSEGIIAAYDQGMLKLTLPKVNKAPASITKEIPII